MRIQKIQQHADITLAGPVREHDPLLRENEQRASQHIASCLAMEFKFGGGMNVSTPVPGHDRTISFEADIDGGHAVAAGPSKDSPFPADLEDAFNSGTPRGPRGGRRIATSPSTTKVGRSFAELEDAFDGGASMTCYGGRKQSPPRKTSPPRKLSFYAEQDPQAPRRPAAPTKTTQVPKRRRLVAWED